MYTKNSHAAINRNKKPFHLYTAALVISVQDADAFVNVIL